LISISWITKKKKEKRKKKKKRNYLLINKTQKCSDRVKK